MKSFETKPFAVISDPFTLGATMNGIKKLTYSEQVVEYIKQAILNGELSPGDPIKEVELAEKLGISRAPIREAIQVLAHDGLIDSKPQKAKTIVALTAKQIKDSYFTGGVLEAAAVTEALPLYTEEDFSTLEKILQKMGHLAEAGDPDSELTELDNAFHGILFSKIDNELLIDLCRRSCQGISKFLLYRHWVKLFQPKMIYARHKMILDALKAGNPAQLEKIIRQHYIESGEQMARFGVDVAEEV
ncbi:GntR family transcriptional regulator [Desulfobaculum bizertense]|nr:GntR family transcriptional regulator [Desulfobaculum bizertense]